MRVRRIKNGDSRYEAHSNLLIPFDKNDIKKIDLREYFKGFSKFRIEIGCGKGSFIVEEAKRNPDVAYIAMEKIRDVMIFAMEKIAENNIPNVLFICGDAEHLDKLFDMQTFERIYINFCDPWPKSKHAKRRLTFRAFLDRYRKILKDDGFIQFKTDNRDLFNFSIEEFSIAGYKLSEVSFNLHESIWDKDNIRTEYENNFSAQGYKINRLVATK